jgi:hypothetical protein
MIAIRTAGICLAAGLLVGCQTREQPRPVEAGPAPIQAAESLRAALMRANPDAQVGIVAAALPDAQLVAVREVPADQFQVGSTVQFVDVDRNPVGMGTVVMIKNDTLHVRYDMEGSRAPQIGDLALRVAQGAPDTGANAAAFDAAAAEGTPAAESTPAAAPMEAEPTRLPPRRGAAPATSPEAPARPAAQPEAQPAQPEVQPEAAPADAAPAEAAPAEAAPAEAAPAEAAATPVDAPVDAPAEKAADAPQAEKPDLNK